MEKEVTVQNLPILVRREVEALILKPFLEEMERELGEERTKAIVTRVITEDALKQGAAMGERYGSNALSDIPGICGNHSKGGALDVEVSWLAENKLLYKTLRCGYCDMYSRIGMEKWGPYLSCMRDEAFFCGINPNFRFERTQELMNGGSCCDSVIIDISREKE